MKKTVFIPIVTIAGSLAAVTPVVALTSCAQQQYKVSVCTDGGLAVPVMVDRTKVNANEAVTFNLVFAPGGVYSVTRITCNDKDISKQQYSVIDRTVTINQGVVNGDIEIFLRFTQAPVISTFHSSIAGGLVSNGVITVDPNKDLEVKYTKTADFKADGIHVDVLVNGNLLEDTDFTVETVEDTFVVTVKKNVQKIIGEVEIKIAGSYGVTFNAVTEAGEAFTDATFDITTCSPLVPCNGTFTFNEEGHSIVDIEIRDPDNHRITYGYSFSKKTDDAKEWNVSLDTNLVQSKLNFKFIVK